MCHSETTRQANYVPDILKEAKAVAVGSHWASKLALPEERVGDQPGMVDQAQAAVFKAGQARAGKVAKEQMLKQQMRQDIQQKATIQRVITNRAKVAFIKCLIACQEGGYYVTKHGKLMDLFLTNNSVWNKRCASIVLRMVFILPFSMECVLELKQSLLDYCDLLDDPVLTPRKVEWMWAWKLLGTILNLQKSCSRLDHPVLQDMFASLAEEHGDKYFLGNEGIRNQLRFIVNNREAGRRKAAVTVKVTDNRKLLAREEKSQLAKRSRKVDTATTVVDESALLGAEEGSQEDIEEKIVDEDDLEMVTYGTEKVLVVGDKVSYIKPNTPVKVMGVKRFEWTNSFLLELLKLYLTKAKDLTARDSGTGRAKARAQLKPIHEKESIVIDGRQVRLDVLDLDTMAKKIAFQGLSWQPKGEGLMDVVDKWLEVTREEVDDIRDKVDDIIEFANEFY